MNPAADGVKPSPYNDGQLAVAAAYANHFFTRDWFEGLLEPENKLVARLLLGVFVCYEQGSLPTKKQAMKFLNAVDARTSHRYITVAEQKGLLTVSQSKTDRRVDLLCPTDMLLAVVKKELGILIDDLRQVTDALSAEGRSKTEIPWYLARHKFIPNRFLTSFGGTEVLLADEKELGEENFADAHVREVARYTETIDLAPNNKAAYRKRAHEYAAAADYDEAIVDYSAMISLDPSDPDPFAWRANAYFDNDAFQQALADYDEAIRLAPSRHDFLFGRGQVLIYLQEYDRAISDLTNVIQAQESDPFAAPPFVGRPIQVKLSESYMLRSEAYEKKGQLERAVADLRALLNVNPLRSDAERKLHSLSERRNVTSSENITPQDKRLGPKKGRSQGKKKKI